jgi:hypothetical protein
MPLFDNLYGRYSSPIVYKDSTDSLRDNLYLLLKKNRVQKLSMMKLILPDRKTHATGDAGQPTAKFGNNVPHNRGT